MEACEQTLKVNGEEREPLFSLLVSSLLSESASLPFCMTPHSVHVSIMQEDCSADQLIPTLFYLLPLGPRTKNEETPEGLRVMYFLPQALELKA